MIRKRITAIAIMMLVAFSTPAWADTVAVTLTIDAGVLSSAILGGGITIVGTPEYTGAAGAASYNRIWCLRD